MSDLIRRMDAMQACQVGPSDEWSKSTRGGYNQAATDCAMNMLRVPAVQPADLIEALTAERDEYKRLALITDTVARECKIHEARAEEAEADNARLLKALEPFASALKGNWSHQPDGTKILCGTSEFDLRLNLTLGDFRRAAAAINTGKEPSHE